ncbi:hypothetical protein BJ875DRAFT_476086 [Amylocarpus encephaloides]|uniref:Uncharacterized protein n=1 Tax=Amylocarpus encephaloides TaxID=45428 RepID=A0A9P7Y9L0_9HELO|nr:hypothetical protein BJ875DRAFT_476086 [Amylocarpus encephaloides]
MPGNAVWHNSYAEAGQGVATPPASTVPDMGLSSCEPVRGGEVVGDGFVERTSFLSYLRLPFSGLLSPTSFIKNLRCCVLRILYQITNPPWTLQVRSRRHELGIPPPRTRLPAFRASSPHACSVDESFRQIHGHRIHMHARTVLYEVGEGAKAVSDPTAKHGGGGPFGLDAGFPKSNKSRPKQEPRCQVRVSDDTVRGDRVARNE